MRKSRPSFGSTCRVSPLPRWLSLGILMSACSARPQPPPPRLGSVASAPAGAASATLVPPLPAPAMPGINVPAIKVNTVGYPSAWRKLAIINREPAGALIRDEQGQVSYVFRARDIESRGRDRASGDLVWHADFSALTRPGRYRVESGAERSDYFSIGPRVYARAVQAGLKSFYFQRCRTALLPPYATWDDKAYVRLEACHVHGDVAWDYATYPRKTRKWHLVGGWHDAGNFEIYVPSTAPSAQALLIAYESHPALFGDDSNIPESGNHTPDILDEVRWGLVWILAMQDEESGAFHAREAVFAWSGPNPVEERTPRWVSGVGSASTAKATAVLAQAARIYRSFDAPFAARCAAAARAGFAFLEQHQERIFVDGKGSHQPLWDDSPEYHEVGARFTAAVEMYRSFRLPEALARARSFLSDPETQPAKFVEGGWPNLSRFAFMSLVSDEKAPADLRAEAERRLLAAVETLRSDIAADGYRCATTLKGYYWGHNANLLEKAHELAFAARLDPSRPWLVEAARDQWHWILGRNPNGYSMVTRVGKGPERIYSMEWGHADPPPPGFVVGGPNSVELGVLAPGAPAKALLWDNPERLTSGLAAHSLWHWEQSDLWDGHFAASGTYDNGWYAATEPDIYYEANFVLTGAEVAFAN